MRAAAQPTKIDDHGDQKPQEIDSCGRHSTVDFPRINDRGKRQKNESKQRQQSTVKCALQVVGEKPRQDERDTRKSQYDDQE